MGIKGLHLASRLYLRRGHVSEYCGKRVGIDASNWLHKGAVPYAVELHTDRKPWVTQRVPAPYVAFAMKLIGKLRSCGVIPVVVFDGCRLPAKADTNAARRAAREVKCAEADKYLAAGNEEAARAALSGCVDVTPAMGAELRQALRAANVQHIVAPYEADAQLAYLASIPPDDGGVQAVITEDGDLIAYGCRALLFKMDTEGYFEELLAENMYAGLPEAPPAGEAAAGGSRQLARVDFSGFTLEMLRAACVLAGCDFLPSLKGIAYATAHKLVARAAGGIDAALRTLRGDKKWADSVNAAYQEGARRAADVFAHALVFDPGAGACRRLTPLPPALAALPADHPHIEFIGADLDQATARGIAYGAIDPHTMEPFTGAPLVPEPTMPLRLVAGGNVTAGAAAAAAQMQQFGLGPPPVLRRIDSLPGQPRQQQQQQQQQQQGRVPAPAWAPAPAGLVFGQAMLEMYGQPAAAAVPAPPLPLQQQQQQRRPAAPMVNPFARPNPQPAAAPAGAPRSRFHPQQAQPAQVQQAAPRVAAAFAVSAGPAMALTQVAGVRMTGTTSAARSRAAAVQPREAPPPAPPTMLHPAAVATIAAPGISGSEATMRSRESSWITLRPSAGEPTSAAARAVGEGSASGMGSGAGTQEVEVTSPLRQRPGGGAAVSAPVRSRLSSVTTMSMGGGSSSGGGGSSSGSLGSAKRRAAAAGGGSGRPSKKQQALAVAAARCARISSFFAPSGAQQQLG